MAANPSLSVGPFFVRVGFNSLVRGGWGTGQSEAAGAAGESGTVGPVRAAVPAAAPAARRGSDHLVGGASFLVGIAISRYDCSSSSKLLGGRVRRCGAGGAVWSRSGWCGGCGILAAPGRRRRFGFCAERKGREPGGVSSGAARIGCGTATERRRPPPLVAWHARPSRGRLAGRTGDGTAWRRPWCSTWVGRASVDTEHQTTATLNGKGGEEDPTGGRDGPAECAGDPTMGDGEQLRGQEDLSKSGSRATVPEGTFSNASPRLRALGEHFWADRSGDQTLSAGALRSWRTRRA